MGRGNPALSFWRVICVRVFVSLFRSFVALRVFVSRCSVLIRLICVVRRNAVVFVCKVACYFPWVKKGGSSIRPLSCGQCIGCKLRRSKEWAIRCVHESSLYDENSFILLTYEKPPFSLDHRDFQDFMRRVRKGYPERRVRYFMCGEYGQPSADNGFSYRPHFHAILFNLWFEDAKYFKLSASGCRLYRSVILEKLWPHGHATIGHVSFDSAAYIARYCTKKVTCPDTEDMYEHIDLDTGEVRTRLPEYGRMSLKPGIGAAWLESFASDVVTDGKVVSRGAKVIAPLFYRRKIKKFGLRSVRLRALSDHEKSLEAQVDDNDNQRIDAKERVVRSRLALFK